MSALPFKVKAVFEYKSPHDDDLNFPNGQIITVTEEEGDEWYVGDYVDSVGGKQEGIFPRNFVERYEPEAPPRPTRTRHKKDDMAPTAQPEAEPVIATRNALESPTKVSVPAVSLQQPRKSESQQVEPETVHAVAEPQAAASVKATVVSKGAPPSVAEKPSSFKDRIAAFNKTSSAPVAPVKPTAPGAGTFIKKPFVAPPPARDAYVAPVRHDPPPAKVYRRDEDPEIVERQAQDLEDAQRAGLTPIVGEEAGEEAPKARTLQERIAALQQQQQEQASRRSELIAKEKPKRPPQQHADTGEYVAEYAEPEPGQLSRVGTSGSRMSSEVSRDHNRPIPERQQSMHARPANVRPASILSNGGDMGESGAGEDTDPEEESTEVEDNEYRARASAAGQQVAAQRGYEEEHATHHRGEEVEGDVEEEEMDAETQRKLELRQRMAKMSGGMGMAGMFGPPAGGVGMQGAAPRTKRASGTSEHRPALEEAQAVPLQRVAVVPIPGLHRSESPESFQEEHSVRREPEAVNIISGRNPREIPDVEDVAQQPAGRAVPSRPHEPPMYPNSPTRQSTLPRSPTFSGMSTSFGSPRSREDRRRFLLQSRKLLGSTISGGCSSYSAYNGAPVMPLTAGIRRRPVPQLAPLGHQAAAPPSAETRGLPPPPPPLQTQVASPGFEADDEMLQRDRMVAPRSPPLPQRQQSFHSDLARSPPAPQRQQSMRAPPPGIPTGVPARPEGPRSPPHSSVTRTSFIQDPSSPYSPAQPANDKRASRPPPPVPVGGPTMSPPGELRAPPPPPPTVVPSVHQQSTVEVPRAHAERLEDEEEDDYEGNYETDNASHRDVMGTRLQEGSSDVGRLSEDMPSRLPAMPPAVAPQTPSSAPRGMPPVPQPVQRGAPPPPPHQPPMRLSADAPRAMPPAPASQEEEAYDPYNYEPSPASGVLPSTSRAWMPDVPIQESNPALYGTPPQRPVERAPPLPPQGPPFEHSRPSRPSPPLNYQPSSVPQSALPRQSREFVGPIPPPAVSAPAPSPAARRPVEQSRPLVDQDYIAQNIDLAESTQWWTQPNLPPPVFQNRNDVLYEVEESTSSKRGGRTTVSKDIYILFPDYSQTTITARFDSREPAEVALEQRHERPPPRPRQDTLEAAHKQFGSAIATAANQRINHAVLDGSPHSLVLDILRKLPNALQPVGSRTYGALTYANLANATVQQFDEIRPGDIITFRNAKFSGKHGAMHNKYSEDVGRPDHVGIVAEWDGTKKKVRIWEQGREGKRGVKLEGFRLGDLRSGEVRVWRVMARSWVGWETQG